jgi:dihydrofolate reductase
MQRLVVFNNVTLDGYFTDPNGDLSWAHHQDPEWDAFVRENARGGGTLLLGRVTYEMMVSYWPTPVAMESDPVLAERMNNLPKVVFSRTLDEPAWKNTRVVAGDIAAKVRRMKQEPGEGMTILGSGTIVAQLAQAGLIDEYQLVVHPVVLGEGRTMFEGVGARLPLKLTGTRAFPNGNVLLSYEAAVHATM